MLRYAVVSRIHSKIRPPLVPFPAVKFDLQRIHRLTCPRETSLRTLFPPTNPFTLLFASDGAFYSFFYIEPPHFTRRSTRSMGNPLIYVEKTGLHGAGHAVETMDAISQAPLLPAKIHLDEIDK